MIADLARAGIVLWMLTGDKEETAINIGHSCNLLLNNTKIHFLTKLTNPEMYAGVLKNIYDDVVANYDPRQGYQVRKTSPALIGSFY